MNHYKQITSRYLRAQRKRTVLTIIGIVLSAALMFASGSMGETLKVQYIQSIINQSGNWHVAYLGVSDSEIEALRSNVKVEAVGSKKDIGSANPKENVKLMLIEADPGYRTMMRYDLLSGREPSKPGEVMLEQWIVEQLGRPKLGEPVQLLVSAPEGEAEGQGKPHEKKESVFTLTGIMKNRTSTQISGSSVAIAISPADQPVSSARDVGVRFKKGADLRTAIDSTTKSLGVPDNKKQENRSLLTALSSSNNQGNNRAVTIVEAIVAGIILAATAAVIYNAFHISVLERIRQFGILRSIGMTPRQVRAVVFREASLLFLIGVPLGLLLGWGAIVLLLQIFKAIDKTSFFSEMSLSIPWIVPIGTVLLTAAAVYLSAFGPARTAGRVSPLTAIMHANQFDKTKATKRKHRIAKLLFGVSGKMAAENMRRNRKRYRITLFSMSVGIVLFIFFNSFLGFIMMNDPRTFKKDMAVRTGYGEDNAKITLAQYEQAARIEGVKRVFRFSETFGNGVVSKDKVTPDYLSNFDSPGKTMFVPLHLVSYHEPAWSIADTRLISGRIDEKAMDAESGVIVSQKGPSPVGRGVTQITNLKVGDTFEVKVNPDTPVVTVKVLGIVDRNPAWIGTYGEQYEILTTEPVFERITGAKGFTSIDIELAKGANAQAVKAGLQSIANGQKDMRVLDFTDNADASAMLQISIMLYGLVTVITVISAINIINTISTNLILRTREFGTLRAVGMTMRQLRRMILLESFWYGIMATVFGGIVGTLLSRWVYSLMNKISGFPYHLPWKSIVIAGAASILISWLASRLPLRRIERMDVIAAVKMDE